MRKVENCWPRDRGLVRNHHGLGGAAQGFLPRNGCQELHTADTSSEALGPHVHLPEEAAGCLCWVRHPLLLGPGPPRCGLW